VAGQHLRAATPHGLQLQHVRQRGQHPHHHLTDCL
jgi:hypothetical protein